MRGKVLGTGCAVVMLLLGACSGKSHDAAPTTSPPTTAATVQASPSTTTVPNPDVIPPVITVAYVNAVFAVLNHVDGNATRALRKSRSLTLAAAEDIRAIYNDPLYASEIMMAADSLKGAINNVRTDAGDRITLVKRLITATRECIFAEVETDFSHVFVHSTPVGASQYYELALKQPNMDLGGLNPTPWAFAVNEAFLTPTSVASSCVDR